MNIKKTKLWKMARKLVKGGSKKKKFPGSTKYWEQRYQENKNSGSGSYGRLAEYKAEVLNGFVKQHSIESVVELGCGDGNQLSLANYPSYIGFDVSSTAIDVCKLKFAEDASKKFYLMKDLNTKKVKAELVLSLDVLYHLIEDKVFHKYMSQLFAISSNYVIIYSSNYDDHFAPHVKCREFTKWIDRYVSDRWQLMEKVPNRYPFDENDPDNTSMSDFYIYKKIK